jgi:glycosyltransferase involved in cell wall biosynthesis
MNMEALPVENIGAGKLRRILMLITTLTFGGAETQVVRLAIELKRRGWQVRIICLVDPSAYVSRLAEHGIGVSSLGMRRGVPDPRAIWRLRGQMTEFRPDVVHSHMVHANLLGRIARVVCPVPALICTAHNIQERSERGGGTRCKEMLYRLTDFLSDRTTIICRAACERYIRVGAAPRKKLEVIHNGVDTARFSPSPETRAADRDALGLAREFVWLAVGRLVEQKDYQVLLRALKLLNGSGWVLLIAGGGPLEGVLRSECERLGFGQRVRFLGAREEIGRLYNAADAFVMSSRYEGLSVALLEAASMGLPSVVTNVGGNTEVVLDGVTGYVVEPEDPEELGRAMRRLSEAPAPVRRKFGAAAREHCLANFRFEGIADKWIELYNVYMPQPA